MSFPGEWLERPRLKLGRYRVDRAPNCWRDSRLECGVQLQAHYVRAASELDDPRLELTALHLAGDGEECVGEVDHDAAERDIRGNGVLVGVGAKNVDARSLLGCLEDPESCSIGILENDVSSSCDLSECLLLAGTRVIPVPDVRGQDAHSWVDTLCSSLECQETLA